MRGLGTGEGCDRRHTGESGGLWSVSRRRPNSYPSHRVDMVGAWQVSGRGYSQRRAPPWAWTLTQETCIDAPRRRQLECHRVACRCICVLPCSSSLIVLLRVFSTSFSGRTLSSGFCVCVCVVCGGACCAEGQGICGPRRERTTCPCGNAGRRVRIVSGCPCNGQCDALRDCALCLCAGGAASRRVVCPACGGSVRFFHIYISVRCSRRARTSR